MDCVNHSGVTATAYCQNCGKALCANCVRNAPGGQILCEPCWVAWHSVQQPFTGSYATGSPNPAVAAALGIIPGVGAMYNGQFLKGFVHVFVFAILVSTASHYGVFGLFIAAWVVYQSFEAFHVAKARRDGQPLPDPLGLNEISNWLNPGGRAQNPPGAAPMPGPGAANPNPGQGAQFSGTPGPYQPPPQTPPWQTPYQQAPYQGPGTGPAGAPGPGYPNPGFPPIPPVPPPLYWKRKEPIGAIILIGLGLMFLLGQLDLFSGRVFEFTWPLLLIGLGVWMVVRHVQDSQGGRK
jgi:TM2 domain-containing membrane protein YozV